ncbi:2-phospho-L-lactate guanylyltransferase [Aestuariicella hydrocarbonica]|uniref:2-phospho-L-lactate guanylyltransferase n=1 Tax=Pseudomaricurvus hydrocarbonicus TaxID=1470433 RepID=A0A9E5JUK6_9GAMM|nr:2-phospho-L-lactate guanylyltransferase [Aestuariicella hydrocarbonica]NHO65878.1 2-phospho-L-lactate guanylyltransferase [Aestuariicella hydrocarbonica]
MMPRINIVIPVKSFQLAKSRLSPVLTSLSRQRLMQNLFLNNLLFLQKHFPLCHLLVVTPDKVAAQWSRERDVTVLLEDQCDGLNAAIEKATRWSVERNFDTQVVFFADIARPQPCDLNQLLSRAGPSNCLLAVPAMDGGTNVLLSTPPSITPAIFGENSYRRLQVHAEKHHIEFNGLNLPSLALDVDRPSDLSVVRADQVWEVAS